jgi:hypothetical protein
MGIQDVKYFVFLLFFVQVMAANTAVKTDLIYSGVDTITSGDAMDFVAQKPCTSATEDNCTGQIVFGRYGVSPDFYFSFSGPNCISRYMGKMNLDSISAAPPDSQLNTGLGTSGTIIFRIFPDSLNSCIGNVYVVKTGKARPAGAYNWPLYVKLKILDFDVLDTASYHIQMIFLWVFNESGNRDLRTPNPVDTFKSLPGIFDGEGTAVNSEKQLRKLAYKRVAVTLASKLFIAPEAPMRVIVVDSQDEAMWDFRGRRISIFAPIKRINR